MSERIKLRASFWSGLVAADVGGVIVPALDAYRDPSVYNATVYPVFSLTAVKSLSSMAAGFVIAFMLRLYADSIISKLDG